MSENDLTPTLPDGFGAALLEDSVARSWFDSLSVPAQQALVTHTRALRSREELRAFVSRMGRDGPTL